MEIMLALLHSAALKVEGQDSVVARNGHTRARSELVREENLVSVCFLQVLSIYSLVR